jgi:Ca-activated chloride channel homolog
MNLLVPAGLGTLALVGPLIVLYMLRSRRTRVEVGSTMLWSPREEQLTSAVPWSRLRWSLLLAAQLLVLALFALSLARPFFAESTVLGPHSVLLIDTSGSMAEADRFEEARSQALELAADTSEQNVVSVIDAGPDPRVVLAYGQAPSDVEAAISPLEVGGGEADLSDAIRLGRGLATPDRPTNLILFSDGGAAPLPEEPVIDLTHVWLDAIADDVSLEVLSVESTGGVTRGLLTVANHSQSPRQVDVAISVDGDQVERIAFDIPAAERQVRTFPLEAGPGAAVTAERLGDPDGNPLDDRIETVIDQASARGVTIEGESSPFTEALVRATPGFETSADGDILIVDRGPLPAIDRPTWIIRSDTPPPGLEPTDLVANVVATFQAPGEPVLDGVDLSELAVAEVQGVEPRGWTPIVRSGDLPLVLLGNVDGHRVVYFTFDLTHSNLPVQVAFPILGAALLDWLGGDAPAQVGSGPAGAPIPLTIPPDASARIDGPSGVPVVLEAGATEFSGTTRPGIYRITYVGGDGVETPGPTAVRTFVATEAGAPVREIPTAGTGAEVQDAATLIREWGPQIVIALLLLLLVEWWIGFQRPLPGRTV